jgi:hypothetical protein
VIDEINTAEKMLQKSGGLANVLAQEQQGNGMSQTIEPPGSATKKFEQYLASAGKVGAAAGLFA